MGNPDGIGRGAGHNRLGAHTIGGNHPMTHDLAALLERAQQSAADPLAALLGRAQDTLKAEKARKERAAQIEKSRKELAAGLLSKDEAAQTRAAIQKWEAQHVWQTVGKTAVFTRHSCGCGECITVFSHWMLDQIHREVETRRRTTRVSLAVLNETAGEIRDTPTRVGFQENVVEMCPVCAGGKGVDLSSTAAFNLVMEKVK
jgi:hypothetical protein